MERLSKRTQLYLSADQWHLLQAESRRRGVSTAEVARQAIDAYLRKPDLISAIDGIAGLWADRNPGTDEFIRSLREEWDRS